ncbi:MAG TPA: hypothetical protein DCR97_08640 [Deltaproteobacteria bacterium]|nr:hypothetical protein [Deltaproteobacteria bacterium]
MFGEVVAIGRGWEGAAFPERRRGGACCRRPIVDAPTAVRDVLRHIPHETDDMQFAGEAGTADEAVRKVGCEHFDGVVLDIYTPGKSGLDILEDVPWISPKTQVLTKMGI